MKELRHENMRVERDNFSANPQGLVCSVSAFREGDSLTLKVNVPDQIFVIFQDIPFEMWRDMIVQNVRESINNAVHMGIDSNVQADAGADA